MDASQKRLQTPWTVPFTQKIHVKKLGGFALSPRED